MAKTSPKTSIPRFMSGLQKDVHVERSPRAIISRQQAVEWGWPNSTAILIFFTTETQRGQAAV
jgi:hypothetical protein